MKKIRKAVFPVGGLGTRFLPATKSIPKEMLPVASKPLVQYAFEEAQKAGIEQFIFVMGRNKNAISNHFDHSYELQNILSNKEKDKELNLTKNWLPQAGSIVFLRQQEPKGLGHAIYCARNVIGDEPFAVLLADEMLQSDEGFLKEMVSSYNKFGGNVVALAEVERSKVSNYGIVEAEIENKFGKITDMVEKPSINEAPSNLSITGRYILEPSVFEYIARSEPGKGGEIQLTDAMKSMLDDGKDYYGQVFDGKRYDCGSLVGFLDANIAYSLDQEEISLSVKEMLKKYAN
ncbi:MAG: UTP--glucose-1-phosphate uridylyltransferase GalU [Rickettsiales bacterium]